MLPENVPALVCMVPTGLASNSLLEAMVFAHRAYKDSVSNIDLHQVPLSGNGECWNYPRLENRWNQCTKRNDPDHTKCKRIKIADE